MARRKLVKCRAYDGGWKQQEILPDSARKAVETDYIYFVQAVEGGPIKIGRSKSPKRRLKAHQVSHPAVLKLCRTVAVHISKAGTMESNIHKHFAHARLQGEWFEPVAELAKLAHAQAA